MHWDIKGVWLMDFLLGDAQSLWNYAELLKTFFWYSRNVFVQEVSLSVDSKTLRTFEFLEAVGLRDERGLQDHAVPICYPTASLR